MRVFYNIIITMLWLALPAHAACRGEDLIAALPESARTDLHSRTQSQPFAEGNVWQAIKDKQQITLVGTYHLADSRHDKMVAQLAPQIAQATTLLVEAREVEQSRLQDHIARSPEVLLITKGPTMPDLLTPDEWQRVQQKAALQNLPAVMAARMRPWYLSMILEMPSCVMKTAASGEGLDARLTQKAEAAGVTVEALEPYDAILTLFDGIGMAGELDILRATLAMSDNPEDHITTLANAYFAGQSLMAWEFSIQHALSQPGVDPKLVTRQFAQMEAALMTQRNKAWLPVILQAAQKGPLVVASGALHMHGKNGLLQLLADQGFTLTPMP